MGAGARYLGLDWALCPRTSPFPLWASVSLSAERSKELSVITWFQPFPPTSQCTDGEAEAQRGDRIPDFIDMRGQSTMGPKPCTCDLWGGVGRGGRRDFWEEAEVWAGWGLPGEGPGVCGARPPAPLMCSPLEVMRRACPPCSRMSCRMPPHTCVHTPPYCVSTVRTLCPAAWPHAHALVRQCIYKSHGLCHSALAGHQGILSRVLGSSSDCSWRAAAGLSSSKPPSFHF